MSNVLNKENIVIVIGEYTDRQSGQPKKQYRTIGELVTMQGSDGTFQFGKIWGAGGVTEFKLFPQQERQNAINQAQGYIPPGVPQGNGYNYDDEPPF